MFLVFFLYISLVVFHPDKELTSVVGCTCQEKWSDLQDVHLTRPHWRMKNWDIRPGHPTAICERRLGLTLLPTENQNLCLSYFDLGTANVFYVNVHWSQLAFQF